MLCVILLLVVVSWCLYFLKFYAPKEKRRQLDLAARVPSFKGALPIIGHCHKLVRGNAQLWKLLVEGSKAAEEAGGVLSFQMGPIPLFGINDPDDALTVLNSCLQKHHYYNIMKPALHEGLITADTATWKKNRKLLNPTFSRHVLDEFLNIFNEQSAQLARDLEPLAGLGEFDAQEHIADCTLASVSRTILSFEMDVKSEANKKFKKAVETGIQLAAFRMGSIWLHPDCIYGLTSMKRQLDDAISAGHNTMRSIIHKRRTERKQEKMANTLLPRRCKALLNLLLDMSEEGLVTDQQILDEVTTIILAAQETTISTVNTLLLLLGSYPDVQEKVYQEVMSVLGSKADMCKEDIPKLVYTEAVIKEALRINPGVPVILRELDKDVQLKNYTLPAGSGCAVLLWGILRLPIWGPDRFEFRPERWLDPASLPQNPGAYCVFSVGRRNCIGKAYAIKIIKTMLVHLIRKFRVTADYSKVKFTFGISTHFVEGHHISLELRK